jgi:hypothetical protein
VTKPGQRPHDHRFVVRHRAKLLILYRAIEQMDTSTETPAESAAAVEMLGRLEELIRRRRKRRRSLAFLKRHA